MLTKESTNDKKQLEKPLKGLRVLDLTQALAGPFCTQILAGLGAEVIKIEQPAHGELARRNPPYAGPSGAHFGRPGKDDMSFSILKRNRNKKGITLDLKSLKGKEIFFQLVRLSDVLVENFSVGVTKRLGIAEEDVRKAKEDIIYCSLTGFGQNGPYKDMPAYDLVVQAMSGAMEVTGWPDLPPLKTGVALGDLLAAVYGAVGILAAVRYRDQTGLGQLVDISMLDSLFSFVFEEAHDLRYKQGFPARQGNELQRLAPFNSFKARDGYIVICAPTDLFTQSLFEAMGKPELIKDPDFKTLEARVANSEKLNKVIENWTKDKSRQEIAEELTKRRVPCSPVANIFEVLINPQLKARQMLQPLSHPTIGMIEEYVAPNLPIKMSRTDVSFDSPAPLLGQHNEEVYCGLLRFTTDELKKLREQEIL